MRAKRLKLSDPLLHKSGEPTGMSLIGHKKVNEAPSPTGQDGTVIPEAPTEEEERAKRKNSFLEDLKKTKRKLASLSPEVRRKPAASPKPSPRVVPAPFPERAPRLLGHRDQRSSASRRRMATRRRSATWTTSSRVRAPPAAALGER